MTLFITFCLSAVLGLLWVQQGFGASPSPSAAVAGAASLDWQPPAEIAAIVRAKQEATGSIVREDNVVDRPPVIDAAAFEDLRAEVTALRRAVDAIPTPPDYARTLGGIVKAIQGVEKRLAGIEGRRASRSSIPVLPAPRP